MTINQSVAQNASNTSPACPYCLTPVDGEAVSCPACGAAHHADCYAECGACAVHGCADSAERRDAAQSASPVSAATLPPPPSGAAPVASYPPPTSAAPVASYAPRPVAGMPSAAPVYPGGQPQTPAGTPATQTGVGPATGGGAGNRRVQVGGRASATIYGGKLLVATSEGVQYEFEL